MHTVEFKIAVNEKNTCQIMVLVNDNIADPNIPFSFVFNYIRRAMNNYQVLSDLLNSLIKQGYLEYCTTKNNRQVFKHHLSKDVNHFRMEYVDIMQDNSNNQRSLEQMLYFVCQTHNLPMPNIIKPKNTLLKMYESYMHPATSQEDKRAQEITLAAGIATSALIMYRLRF